MKRSPNRRSWSTLAFGPLYESSETANKISSACWIQEQRAFGDVSAWLPSSTSKQRIVRSRIRPFPRSRFYRGGFQTNGLQTLSSRMPISISCNAALGEPNLVSGRAEQVTPIYPRGRSISITAERSRTLSKIASRPSGEMSHRAFSRWHPARSKLWPSTQMDRLRATTALFPG